VYVWGITWSIAMMAKQLAELLEAVQRGRVGVDEAVERLKTLPFEDVGFAKIDHHRALRRGFPEVIFGEGKPPDRIVEIAKRMAARGENVLVTRIDPEKAGQVMAGLPDATYNRDGRVLTVRVSDVPTTGRGPVLVISAGTSDVAVAEEATVTAEFMGNQVDRLYDVGVAGIHRVLDNTERLRRATVLIVVAGMEGALPSVVGGLVERPVIAVPTSVGYGASLGGIAALLGMLNSCAAGVTVVNIDNGFGAAAAATLINRM
jgi:NCAIR mutase (PurE)-related protein